MLAACAGFLVRDETPEDGPGRAAGRGQYFWGVLSVVVTLVWLIALLAPAVVAISVAQPADGGLPS